MSLKDGAGRVKRRPRTRPTSRPCHRATVPVRGCTAWSWHEFKHGAPSGAPTVPANSSASDPSRSIRSSTSSSSGRVRSTRRHSARLAGGRCRLWRLRGIRRPLDPFMGGGSTVAAAVSIGYESIGVEVDPKFFSSAVEAIPALAALPGNGRASSRIGSKANLDLQRSLALPLEP